ncbi:MAG: Fe-S-containing protein [Syntrophomonadaceae bacterium]|jgi:uncharacterized membrane protein|nr:Fe-S-containing protein [Syntrophomonadaceae bacterium]
MMKYLLQVVQNSLSAAIILALVFALLYNGKGAGANQKKWIAAGSLAGSVFALTLAFLKSTTVLINREYWNIGILSVSVIAGIVFIMFLWGFLKNRRPKLYNVLLYSSGAVFCGTLLFYTLPDIFLYPAEFLMMGESAFSTDFLFKLIGYAAGLLLVFLAGLSLFKAGISLPAKTHMALLTIGIGVNAVNQILKVTQSLYAQRVIPTSRFLFNILKQAVNYNDYFLYLIMAVTFMIPVFLWIKNYTPKGPYANPAEHRKFKAALRRKRRWSAAVVFCYILAVLCLTVVKTYEAREVVLSPVEPMNITGGEITIPSANINDGHLHRFMYTASDGTEVRFIVIKKNETAYGVGLDACDICGPTGYYERKDEVICKLCDVVMNKSTIGFKGGCNPVPLAYTMENGNMVIQTAHLEKEKGRFR